MWRDEKEQVCEKKHISIFSYDNRGEGGSRGGMAEKTEGAEGMKMAKKLRRKILGEKSSLCSLCPPCEHLLRKTYLILYNNV